MKKSEAIKKCCVCSCSKKVAVIVGGVAVAVLLAVGVCKMCCGPKIVVVDFDRVQQEAAVYRAIGVEHQKHEAQLKADLDQTAAALQKEEEELNAKKGKLGEKEFKKQSLALNRKVAEAQQKYGIWNQQINGATQLTAQKVQGDLQAVLKEMSSGVDMILSKAVTAYASDKVDITDKFIKALDDKVQSVEYINPQTVNLTVGGQ